ncbi:MAG: glycoside hydrolase family protein, partial [Caulobacteraceae bacterium]
GLRLRAYRDTAGVWTVGYGHAHVAPGTTWTLDRAEAELRLDVAAAMRDLDHAAPWWREVDAVRQDALVEITFNIGIGAVLGFHRALAAMRAGAWGAAAADLLASAWAREVGARATRIAGMIENNARENQPSENQKRTSP